MSRKKLSTVVFMFMLVVALMHPGMPAVFAQELTRSSAGGITSQSVTPVNYSQHARLAAFAPPFGESAKSDTAAGPASSGLVLPGEGVATPVDKGREENDKCDCAERLFPQFDNAIPAGE